MIVTEVFKSMVQGPLGSCMTRTVSLGVDNESGILSLVNGAMDAVFPGLKIVYLNLWNAVCRVGI